MMGKAPMVTLEQSKQVLQEQYGLGGEISLLPGELDFNFRVKTPEQDYVLKISQPGTDKNTLDFQCEILDELHNAGLAIEVPKVIENLQQETLGSLKLASSQTVYVRLLTWIDGIVWSNLFRHDETLLFSLGKEAGKITYALQDFNHKYAKREFDWDLNHCFWTKDFQSDFQGEQKELICHFYKGFESIWPQLKTCRKSVVHNDVNDYNILVSSSDLSHVNAIIDYGDSVYTSTINDLAICLTYAVMGKPDPIQAAFPIIEGYHSSFPLNEQELGLLYWLIGARLVISLTKSNINRQKNPENEYLGISEKPAWELIKKWKEINPVLAEAFFRKACGFPAHRNFEKFETYANNNSISTENILNLSATIPVESIDLDISSLTIPELSVYRDPKKKNIRIKQIWEEKDQPLLVGGYGEIRPDFISEKNKKETNNGPVWESQLLGTQFWVFKDYEVNAVFGGTVIFIEDQIVSLEHEMADNLVLYSIYRNINPIEGISLGDQVKSDSVLGTFEGTKQPEIYQPLFFQISLINPNLVPPKKTCTYYEGSVLQELYPSPDLLFKENHTKNKKEDAAELIAYRKKHLGKSLSLSYQKPLKMLRGDGISLLDSTGRKYMDMVNNVAHVGHEHPRVVKAGQQQMAMLNTNSRYLHDSITEFAKNLLATMPQELSVVHFVNSGSEANELAIRMAKAYTGQKDFIAVEVGYHGNSNACIDISSYKFDGKGGAGAPENTHIVPLPDTFRGRYTGSGSGEKYVAHVKEQLNKIKNLGRGPAAFICESIISCGGQIELPENYLKMAYSYTREAGGLCIADEVQVGCGRVGSSFWGFQLHQVIPDIVTIGKPIGNGHPLAAVVCTQKVAESFANGMEYFNTFGGNPVSSTIGNTVLEVLKAEKLQENALSTGNYLKQQLTQLQQEFTIIADVRGQGLFLGFELADSKKAPLPNKAAYLVERMRELGILMSSDGPDHNVLKIKPPMVFNTNHADELIYRLRQVLSENYMKIA